MPPRDVPGSGHRHHVPGLCLRLRHAAVTRVALATAGDHRVDKDGKRFDRAGVFAVRQSNEAGDKLHVGGGDCSNHLHAAGAMKQRLHPERCVVSDSWTNISCMLLVSGVPTRHNQWVQASS